MRVSEILMASSCGWIIIGAVTQETTESLSLTVFLVGIYVALFGIYLHLRDERK